MSVFLKEEFNNYIPEAYKKAIILSANFAEQRNKKIYLIGGIVRDLILKNPIKDIDITLESDAIDFCRLLEKEGNCKIIAEQENLRTAKVKFDNGVEIDFASTREEKYSKGGILPTAYNFGCKLSNDVKRRDFTINTLALNLTSNDKFKLVDFYNGFNDIKNKEIKILHNKSFYDDPSRIIRALKFQIRFDFKIEEQTYSLIQNYLSNVDRTIPLERIKNELHQYFSIEKPEIYNNIIKANAYKLITQKPVISINSNILTEIKKYNLFSKTDLWFIYFALLIVNSEIIDERLNLTSIEKRLIKEVQELLIREIENPNNKKEIYDKFNNKNNLSIAIYYLITHDNNVKTYLETLKEIKILITGKDLIDLGFKPSKYFNELFEKVLTEKLDEKITTKEEEIEFVKQFIKK